LHKPLQQEAEIISPTPVHLIRAELRDEHLLGYTRDKKGIYLFSYDDAPHILREITRLRELTFRKVGEGTGKERDYDNFDHHYQHILLWDDKLQEIVGSYRLGVVADIISQYGKEGLITSRKFDLRHGFDVFLPSSLEVGRSFVQEQYWGTSALDYLWQGIGAYLRRFPQIRYLWGTVSMSDTMPKPGKDLMVSYYMKWYGGDRDLAVPYHPFVMSDQESQKASGILHANNHNDDFILLKKALKEMGTGVPVLFRRYTDICVYGGVQFIDFCVDLNFKNSVDGFMIFDLSMLKPEMSARYYSGQRSF
jgi:hypothetical protein